MPAQDGRGNDVSSGERNDRPDRAGNQLIEALGDPARIMPLDHRDRGVVQGCHQPDRQDAESRQSLTTCNARTHTPLTPPSSLTSRPRPPLPHPSGGQKSRDATLPDTASRPRFLAPTPAARRRALWSGWRMHPACHAHVTLLGLLLCAGAAQGRLPICPTSSPSSARPSPARNAAQPRPRRMSTNACQFFWDCTGCGTVLRPKPGNCCVLCSYATVPCPPIQIEGKGASCCGWTQATAQRRHRMTPRQPRTERGGPHISAPCRRKQHYDALPIAWTTANLQSHLRPVRILACDPSLGGSH